MCTCALFKYTIIIKANKAQQQTDTQQFQDAGFHSFLVLRGRGDSKTREETRSVQRPREGTTPVPADFQAEQERSLRALTSMDSTDTEMRRYVYQTHKHT